MDLWDIYFVFPFHLDLVACIFTLTLLAVGRGRMTWRGSYSGRSSREQSLRPQRPLAQPPLSSGLLVAPLISE